MRPKEYRIKELLREKGLDGAIVSSPENFHYVTGFGGHQHTVSRRGCRISKYFCWAAALLSAQNGIEISYGSDAIL